MQKIIFLLTFLVSSSYTIAQQKLFPGKMTPIFENKPNAIFFNDTLYKGAKQFKNLFYRTGDALIIDEYKRHQSQKIIGNTIATIGSLAIIIGIRAASQKNGSINQGTGWALIGGGLITSIGGGLFITNANRHLYAATQIFNNKYTKTTAGIALTNNGVGLVVGL